VCKPGWLQSPPEKPGRLSLLSGWMRGKSFKRVVSGLAFRSVSFLPAFPDCTYVTDAMSSISILSCYFILSPQPCSFTVPSGPSSPISQTTNAEQYASRSESSGLLGSGSRIPHRGSSRISRWVHQFPFPSPPFPPYRLPRI